MHRLRSARLKLARAEEHLAELRTEHHRFIERNPYRALREMDGDPARYLWRVKIMEDPPFTRFASLIGDFAHNLRSALDHTAYELVRINRPNEERMEFPIFKDRGSFDRDHAKKLPGISPKVLTLIKWVQPYRRAMPHGDGLWIVHQLDIIDKHRRLHLVGSALEASGWSATGGKVVDIEPMLGPFEDGAVIGRYRIVPDPDSRGVEVYTQFAFGIAFGQGEPGQGASVLPLLEALRVWVGTTISRFERFLR